MRFVVRPGVGVLVLSIALSLGPCLAPASDSPDEPQAAPSPTSFPTKADEKTKGFLPYHQLTVDDFRVDDSAHPQAVYWIQPFVRYYYHLTMKTAFGGTVFAYVMDWTVFSGLDRNGSSRKSKFHRMKAELGYAQAILDINEIYARRLAALQPGELPRGTGKSFAEASRDLSQRLNELYLVQMFGAKKEMEDLQTATDYGRDKTKLRELTAAITKRLRSLPAPPSPSASGSPGARSGEGATPTATPQASVSP
jgi:hypothetical protein